MRLRLVGSSVGLLLAVLLVAHAETGDMVIREVEIRNAGAGTIDQSFVQTHISLRAGSKMDRGVVSRDVKALLGTGRFSDVRAEVEDVPEGVKLIYALKNRQRLAGPVKITGNDHFGESKIRDLLGLQPGDVVDDQILGARAQKVLSEYRADSYPDASVSWKTAETDKGMGAVSVEALIREGRRARIDKVVFTGNHTIPSSELRKDLKPPSWWNVFKWFRRGEYDRERIEEASLLMRARYLDRGYLDAQVSPPQVQKDAQGRMTITYRINEGIPFRFGGMAFTGVTLFPEAQVRQGVTLRGGAVASQADIDKASQAVRDFYGARGYFPTVVKTVVTPDRSRGTADVAFAVSEGRLTKIRNVLIRGNTRTRDKVIRREVLVHPGEIFNEVKVRQSERVLSNLGYFSSVRSDYLSTDVPDVRDLTFQVDEKPTGQFMVGAGFSSIDQLMGFVELSQGNFDIFGWPTFTGGGQKLKLGTQFGSKRKEYNLSFVEPWFLDRKLALGVDLYRSDVSYTDYDVKRTGAAISLTKPIPGANRVGLQYSIESSKLSNIADTNRYVYYDPPHDDFYFSDQEDRIKSTVKLSMTHDTRNRAFVPSSGDFSTVFGSLSGGPFGFDTEIYNLGLNVAHYVPLWFGHVLQLRTRWEVVAPYGGADDVPLSDRLFVGGGRTIRGYDYREVGPKVVPADPNSNARRYRAVGGQTLALAKADYTIPIIDAVRIGAFFDIGNVWRDAYEVDSSKLASSVGAGIRLDIPGFPIAIDRAWPVKKDEPITDTSAWVFWIGYEY